MKKKDIKRQATPKEMSRRNPESPDHIDCVDKANACCNRIATLGTLLWNQRENPVEEIGRMLNLYVWAGSMIAEETDQLKDLLGKIHPPSSD